MAEDRQAHSGAVGICVCGSVSMAGEADLADDAGEPSAGGAGRVAASVCGWLCAQERRDYEDRAVWVYAESAVSGLDDDCLWFCGGGVELADSGGAGDSVCG